MKLLTEDQWKKEEEVTDGHWKPEQEVLEECENCEREMEQRMWEICEHMDVLSKLVREAS